MKSTTTVKIASIFGIFCALFTLFLYIYDYREAHKLGRVINRPPLVTLPVLEILREVKLNNPNIDIFNGSIIEDPSNPHQYLLTYRITENDFTKMRHSVAGIITLNEHLQNVSEQQLDLISQYNLTHAIDEQIIEPEDARIIQAKNELYLIYHVQQHGLRSMFIAQVKNTDSKFYISEINKLHYPDGVGSHQKNWSPFVYQDELYFIYSATPHTILHYDFSTKQLALAYQTESAKKIVQKLWPYGEIKGGTPAIYIPELDAYLTFFHSFVRYKFGEPEWAGRIEPLWRIYYMGAYIFDSKPPFKILAMTKRPLSYAGQYKDRNTNYHIIFPCGFVARENEFVISSGIADRKLILHKLAKDQLYQNLTWLPEQAE